MRSRGGKRAGSATAATDIEKRLDKEAHAARTVKDELDEEQLQKRMRFGRMDMFCTVKVKIFSSFQIPTVNRLLLLLLLLGKILRLCQIIIY